MGTQWLSWSTLIRRRSNHSIMESPICLMEWDVNINIMSDFREDSLRKRFIR